VSIQSVFDQAAERYDRARRQLVPCFEDLYGTVIERIPFERDAAIRVLDLGAGTGLLSAFIAESFPSARLTLVDISEAMLTHARRRFADRAARVEFRRLDLAREPLCGQYEAVVSALAIHHLKNDAKRRLFQEAHDVLCDAGVFVNADQVLGRTPAIDDEYKAAWLRQVRERGVREDDLAAALERMKHDEMATLSLQVKYLKDVGFTAVDCWYESDGFVVYGGRRRAEGADGDRAVRGASPVRARGGNR
jgi:tRNA (cmo5U34)-methyltransferase